MFDEKMDIRKDLSTGGIIGNTGFRRAPADSSGVPELCRARADPRGARREEGRHGRHYDE
jgi:hypothetical protein